MSFPHLAFFSLNLLSYLRLEFFLILFVWNITFLIVVLRVLFFSLFKIFVSCRDLNVFVYYFFRNLDNPDSLIQGSKKGTEASGI